MFDVDGKLLFSNVCVYDIIGFLESFLVVGMFYVVYNSYWFGVEFFNFDEYGWVCWVSGKLLEGY